MEINIDRLILDGFDARDRLAIRSVVESELARLIRENGPPSGTAEDARTIDAGVMEITPGASPRQIGIEIARSIYKGLDD